MTNMKEQNLDSVPSRKGFFQVRFLPKDLSCHKYLGKLLAK